MKFSYRPFRNPRWARVLSASLLLAALATSTAVGQENGTPESEQPQLQEVDTETRAKAVGLINNVAARLEKTSVMRADYIQERTSPLLIEPLISRGTLLQRSEPACLLFQVAKPHPASIRMDQGSYQVHRPDEKTAERFVFEGGHAGHALLSTLRPEATQLFADFALIEYVEDEATQSKDSVAGTSPALAMMILRPRDPRARKHVDSVVFLVDMRRNLPVSVAYVDREGYLVSLKLDEIALDPEIENLDELFSADLPEGTKLLVHQVEAE